MSTQKRIVVLPDTHSPDVDWESLNPVLSFIRYYKPTHLVHLGDLCNFDALSKYEPRNVEATKNTLDEEVKSANDLIDKLEKAVGRKCIKTITGGNHCARYPRYKVNHGFKTEISMLHKFTSWQEEYNLPKRGWESCEYGQWVTIGHIVFTHGWFIGGSHAKRHLALFHKCIIYGHTHEWQIATGTGIDSLPIVSASIGTLSNHDLSYLVGKPPVNWCSMFAYIDMRADGSFTPHFVTVINSRFIEYGKEFGGNNATKRI